MRVHGAFLLTQFCWGSAGVINKIGLSGVGIHPLLFALLREALAAPILVGLILIAKRWRLVRARSNTGEDSAFVEPQPAPFALRALPGLFIFVDQSCGLIGVMLADAVSAAAWQPSQVVLTAMLSACLGMERLTRWKVTAIFLTMCGALCLVFLNPAGSGSRGTSPLADPKLGHLFLFASCFASSMEVIAWRQLLRQANSPLAHFAVMAESYLVSACLMAVACAATSVSSDVTDFLCPKCDNSPWRLRPKALWPIGYAVVVQTIMGYLCMAWALRFAESYLASLYATAQPVMAAAVTALFLLCDFNPGHVLRRPGYELIGAVLIILGLLVSQRGESSRAAAHCRSESGRDRA